MFEPINCDVIVCGRVIGKATGYDKIAKLARIYYDFIPAEGFIGPEFFGDENHLAVFYIDGKFKSYKEGAPYAVTDLLESIMACRKV